MKKIFLLTTLLCAACWQAEAQYVSKAWVSDQKDGTYINPVLHADYSDPDVCVAGEDFYMTASDVLPVCPFSIPKIWLTGNTQAMR